MERNLDAEVGIVAARTKLRFLAEVLVTGDDEGITLTANGTAGLYGIVSDIEDNLTKAATCHCFNE